jgi:hypothetical protein
LRGVIAQKDIKQTGYEKHKENKKEIAVQTISQHKPRKQDQINNVSKVKFKRLRKKNKRVDEYRKINADHYQHLFWIIVETIYRAVQIWILLRKVKILLIPEIFQFLLAQKPRKQ